MQRISKKDRSLLTTQQLQLYFKWKQSNSAIRKRRIQLRKNRYREKYFVEAQFTTQVYGVLGAKGLIEFLLFLFFFFRF